MIMTADWHLGLETDSILAKSGIPSKVSDTATRIREIIDYAAATKQDIWVLGDVFDTPDPKMYAVGILFGLCKHALAHGVDIKIIPGNHDSGVRWISLLAADSADFPNVVVYTRPCRVFSEDVSIFILPHIAKAYIRDIYGDSVEAFISQSEYRHSDILIGHAQILGVSNESETANGLCNYMEIDRKKLYPFNLAVFGHNHKHFDILAGKEKKKFHLLSPGSIVMNDFGERDDIKGFIEIDSATLKWKFIELRSPVRKYRQIVIDLVNKDSLDLSDEEKIERAAKDKLLKIIVHASSYLQVDEVAIKEAFNKFGTVVRFQVVTHRGTVDKSSKATAVCSVNHFSLLKDHLDTLGDVSDSVKQLALREGREIIQKCL